MGINYRFKIQTEEVRNFTTCDNAALAKKEVTNKRNIKRIE